jgi:AsmA family/AsmA-like C-terminal region
VGADAESGAVKLFSSKRRALLAAVVILLALFLVRPGVSRLKARIANSISRAVARPVEIGTVHLRFLPRPGFDLENLAIYEDPAFGAEPMLRAREVVAAVRITSLLRGHLDIARLELTEPSLNLVRRADGRWNLEDLLERTERIPLAPTAKSKSEARPGFPYIEATAGRINFKAGQEKKPYALLNADFALWQESEDTWGVRLKAEPLRTDMSLSDSGLLQMSGTWRRAGSLRETPLQFSVAWDHAQLGQLSKLVSGNDKGWRGEVQLSATLAGIPAAMQVSADASIQDFHRYDILSSGGLRLKAHCDGRYASVEAAMHEIRCTAPVGDGMITLRGDAGLPGVHKVDVSLTMEAVPVSAVAQLSRRAKKDLPADLVSSGNVQGSFTVNEAGITPHGPEFQGQGEITNLRLQSINTKVDFAVAKVPFALNSGHSAAHAASKIKRAASTEVLPAPDELHVTYGPFPVALGRPVAAQARGWVARSGFAMFIRGDGEISRTLRMAGLLGLPAMKASVEGTAQMDLQIAGRWTGNVPGNVAGMVAGNISENESAFSLPEVTGTVHLRDVTATVRGTNGPLEISSAEVQLARDEVRVEQLNARAAGAEWTGTLALPRGCGAPGVCLVRFNLSSDEIGIDGLREWLSAPASERRWYQILSPSQPAAPTFLQNLRASGKVSASRFNMRSVIANRVSADLELDRGKLKISELRGDVLNGKHRGEWQADFTGKSPVYRGSGSVTGISLAEISDAMHDPWISGTGSGSYEVSASAADSAEFWQSAGGSLEFDLHDGTLPHISLASDEGPLRIAHWKGRARLHAGKFEIEKGKLISPAGAFEIGGTASLGRVLDLKLTRNAETKPGGAGSMVYTITGTLAEPQIALATPETRAQLKP